MTNKPIVPRIERGVPMPEKRSRQAWPFGEMRIGDSILISSSEFRNASSLCGNANRKHKPMRFTSRATDTGVRIWRVE